MTVVADSSWVIALRNTSDVHHKSAVASRRRLRDQVMVLAPLTLAECLVTPSLAGEEEAAERALRAAFEIASDDASAPLRWAQCRAATGLTLPDAIVLETAHRASASGIATFDDALAAASRKAGFKVYR